jgi:hypothetical protein
MTVGSVISERVAGFKRIHLLSVGVVMLPFAAYAYMKLGVAWPCIFKAFTGLPCATCGGIRALNAMAHLDLLGAIRFNPMVVMAFFAMLSFPFMGWQTLPKKFWPIFWTILILNWLYLIGYLRS